MSDPVIDPPQNPTPADAPRAPKAIVCEFCDCHLGQDGSYKKMSDKAREFRRQDEAIERLSNDLAAARLQLASVTSELAALKHVETKKNSW